MIETYLKALAAQALDHELGSLETDIWAAVAMRELRSRLSRRIAASQALVLVLALVGSVIAGLHWASTGPTDELRVFSPRSAWVASARLLGDPTR